MLGCPALRTGTVGQESFMVNQLSLHTQVSYSHIHVYTYTCMYMYKHNSQRMYMYIHVHKVQSPEAIGMLSKMKCMYIHMS